MQPIINALLDPVVNFGKVTVSGGYPAGIDNIAVTLIVGDGSKLPNPADPAGSFNLVWFDSSTYSDPADDPKVEIVRCIANVNDTLTLMRAQEGTSVSTKNTSGKIYKMILSPTKRTIDDIGIESQSKVNTHSALSTGIHGVTSNIVGISDTQILTNKTITDSTNNVTARSLKSATAVIDVSSATAPSTGQVLTATGSTTATWQTPALLQNQLIKNILLPNPIFSDYTNEPNVNDKDPTTYAEKNYATGGARDSWIHWYLSYALNIPQHWILSIECGVVNGLNDTTVHQIEYSHDNINWYVISGSNNSFGSGSIDRSIINAQGYSQYFRIHTSMYTPNGNPHSIISRIYEIALIY